MAVEYNRVLHENAERALRPGGPFGFLINDVPEVVGDRCALDLQLREKNKLMYYHGTTCLLVVQFKFTETGEILAIATAAKSYGQKKKCAAEYARVMVTWRVDQATAFRAAVEAYLPKAITAANKRYYGDATEGYWQNRLCVRFGLGWVPSDEWLILDRECVIGFKKGPEKTAFYDKARSAYQLIRKKLHEGTTGKWGKPALKAFGDELDMLAIDATGRLIVIELKRRSNSSGIYWGPLQVGLYHQAFSAALGKIGDDIKKLALQKIRLRLLPEEAASRLNLGNLSMGEPVLAVANPNKRSGCLMKMGQVMDEMRNAGLPDQSLKYAGVSMKSGKIEVQVEDARKAAAAAG